MLHSHTTTRTHTTIMLVIVGIVALCTAAAARPQEFKPSKLITSNEPGFFTASDAIIPEGRRDGRSFNSGPVPSQQIEEYKGEIITGPSSSFDLGSFESSEDGGSHVVSGSYNIGTPQGVKQTIVKYKETPGLFAQVNGRSNSKKNSVIGKVIYGTHKDRPLPPSELYIITAARREQEASRRSFATKRHVNNDKSFRKRKFN